MINERLIDTEVAAENGGGNAGEEGLILHLDANDVDSYDGDGSEWIDITNHEYTPATNVSEHFNTVLYTGNETSQSIQGVGFQPDFIWVKNRDASSSNLVFDSIRGNNYIIPNGAFAESTSPSNTLSSFDSDGFTVSGGGASLNNTNDDFVAWCFKAGGAAVSNTDGGISSNVSVNNDLAFSIVDYTATGVDSTVGHGLDVPPELIIAKPYNQAYNWVVYAAPLGAGKVANLNLTNAFTSSSTFMNDTEPTASVFTAGNQNNLNYASGDKVIAYCFASKRGVSKVGSFEGTGAAGNKVYTGFEPAFILTKRTSTSGSGWYIIDNKRSTDSDKNDYLSANTNGAEVTSSSSVTFNRDGFTFNGASFNTSGQTHIYYAVAKNTNETSLTPDEDLELHLDAGDDTTVSTSTWSDKTSNGNDSTFTNFSSTLINFYDKELGNYINLNGSTEYVSTPYNINPINDYTFEGWFNQDVAEGVIVWGMNNGSVYQQIYAGIEADGDVRLGADSGSNHLISTSQPITVGKWHHIVWVYSPSNNIRKIYVDGEQVASSASNWTRQSATRAIWIGVRNNSGTPIAHFDGKIGQFRVYDSILTEAQIRQNYNFTKPSYPNGVNFLNAGDRANWLPEGSWNFNSNSNYLFCPEGAFQHKLGNSNFAFSAWLRTDTIASGFASIIEQRGYSDGSNNGFGIYRNGSSLEMYARAAEGSARQLVSVSGAFTASTWVHIVVQRTGTTWEVYVNGSIATNTGSYKDNSTYQTDDLGNSDAADSQLIIGRQWQANAQQWLGRMADIKFFSKALSAAEVTAQFAIKQFDIG